MTASKAGADFFIQNNSRPIFISETCTTPSLSVATILNIAPCQLAINPFSDNVGCVKHFSNTLLHALEEERHFALSEKVPCPTKARIVIVLGQELGPTHPSLRSATAIMITDSDSPSQGSRMPNQYHGVLLHTIGISGLSCVRTETLCLLITSPLTPHPVQSDG